VWIVIALTATAFVPFRQWSAAQFLPYVLATAFLCANA